MKQAYVLINCDGGSEKALIEQIKHINGVKEVHGTYGAFDIIAEVEDQKDNVQSTTIVRTIRQIEHIKSTQTLIGLDTGEYKPFLADIIPDIIPEEKKPLEPRGEFDEGKDEEEDESEDLFDYSQLED